MLDFILSHRYIGNLDCFLEFFMLEPAISIHIHGNKSRSKVIHSLFRKFSCHKSECQLPNLCSLFEILDILVAFKTQNCFSTWLETREPFMLPSLVRIESIVRIFNQKMVYEVLSLFRNLFESLMIIVELSFQHIFNDFFVIVSRERNFSTQKDVRNYSHRP